MERCPGQETRYWRPEDVSEVQCGNCGQAVEFFKTDGSRRCPGCGKRVVNPAVSLGCAQWCEHAKECLGFDPESASLTDPEAESIAGKLIEALKGEFSGDQKRISHALRVLDCAENLLRREGGDPRIVVAAALLHDIGIREAERKHGSAAPAYQEAEGPPIAGRILQDIGFDEAAIRHVCRIVGSHHSGRDVDTVEFRIVWDADWTVNLPEEFSELDAAALAELVDRTFRTTAGKERARELFLGPGAPPRGA